MLGSLARGRFKNTLPQGHFQSHKATHQLTVGASVIGQHRWEILGYISEGPTRGCLKGGSKDIRNWRNPSAPGLDSLEQKKKLPLILLFRIVFTTSMFWSLKQAGCYQGAGWVPNSLGGALEKIDTHFAFTRTLLPEKHHAPTARLELAPKRTTGICPFAESPFCEVQKGNLKKTTHFVGRLKKDTPTWSLHDPYKMGQCSHYFG